MYMYTHKRKNFFPLQSATSVLPGGKATTPSTNAGNTSFYHFMHI